MNRLSQNTMNILSIISVVACHFGTIYALLIDKFSLPETLGSIAGKYIFLYFVAFLPSVVVNLLTCFMYKTWPVHKLYFSDIFQIVGYAFGIMLLLYAVQFKETTPSNIEYYPPCVFAFLITVISIIIRNIFRLRDK